MILYAGALLHLPTGVPSAVYDIGWWRDLLVAVALAAAWCEARARRGAALAFATAFGVLAVGFWVLALARPYGVLVDPGTTAWAADVAVAGWSGGGDRFLAGEPGTGGPWTSWAHHVRPDLLILAPTVLPVLVLPVSALAVAWLWGRRRDASLAAIVWLGAATGGLETLRGLGFVPRLWSRPLASLLWVATAAAVLVIARLVPGWRLRTGLGVVVVLGWALLGRRGPAVGPWDTLFALTLDNHVWLLLGVAGLVRTRDPAAGALAGGGAALSLLRALGGPGDIWAGTTLCRLGLLLAATAWTVPAVSTLAGGSLPADVARLLARLRVAPERAATAVLVALVLAGGLLAWWDPPRTDAIAHVSIEPVPEALATAMDWIRTHTPPDSAVMADDEYATAVPILGGRRVLRAPSALAAPDDERRRRLERAVLAGRPPAALLQRYGLRYVLVAPGQFREDGIVAPDDLDRTAGLRLAYANAKGMRVYEIVAAASGAVTPAAGGGGQPIK